MALSFGAELLLIIGHNVSLCLRLFGIGFVSTRLCCGLIRKGMTQFFLTLKQFVLIWMYVVPETACFCSFHGSCPFFCVLLAVALNYRHRYIVSMWQVISKCNLDLSLQGRHSNTVFFWDQCRRLSV